MYIYLVFTIIAISIVSWYLRRKRQMSLFVRLKIPGPEPRLITGNLKELNEKGLHECQLQWTRKYGKILGYYLGAKPILLVSDTELLKYVQVKNFQDFMDRPIFPTDGGIPDHRIFQGISFRTGNRWRELRSLISPGFTANKMKQMTQPMNKASEILLDIMKEKSEKNERLEVTKLLRSLTLDIIQRTVFGIQSNVQLHSSGIYQESFRKITDITLSDGTIWLILCLPELESIFTICRRAVDILRYLFGLSSIFYLFEHFKGVIKKRKTEKIVRPDLLQLLIDANMSEKQMERMTGEELSASLENDDEKIKKESKTSSKLHYINDDEVVANAMIFMLAGHDTTAITLSFVIHLLAIYPHVQERLREEVNRILTSEELNYSAITKMDYMGQVISETLRLYPIVLMFILRTVGKSFTYKNYYLPKGLAIQPALWQMHRDPELWEDVENFDPERFSPSRKAEINIYAYQPFGAGPRNCIGLRFAYTVMKLVLAQLLHSFKFVTEETNNTENLKIEFQLFLFKPENKKSIYAMKL